MPSTITKLHTAQGVKDYEPRVVNQLLDFAYRYVCEVLQDAEVRALWYPCIANLLLGRVVAPGN